MKSKDSACLVNKSWLYALIVLFKTKVECVIQIIIKNTYVQNSKVNIFIFEANHFRKEVFNVWFRFCIYSIDKLESSPTLRINRLKPSEQFTSSIVHAKLRMF